MGQKMVSGAGLTTGQEKFLAVVLQEPYLLKHFYLSGGTALSCWYLHHRESYDLDFFSEQKEVKSAWLIRWLNKNRQKIGYDKMEYEEQLGFHFFNFIFLKSGTLKVDFSYFPSSRIEKGLMWEGLSIDSLYDIAVNKCQTIMSAPRAKDYIDLYFILQKTNWDMQKLRQDAINKFGISTDPINMSRQFLRVVEFTDYPKMLVPLNQKEMENFFLSLAKSLEKEIFI